MGEKFTHLLTFTSQDNEEWNLFQWNASSPRPQRSEGHFHTHARKNTTRGKAQKLLTVRQSAFVSGANRAPVEEPKGKPPNSSAHHKETSNAFGGLVVSI